MLRKQTSETDPSDWFAFASERIRSADVLFEHEGFTATGLEALQEGVERYLKGYLVAKGWALVKTHDLVRLVREASGFEPTFGQYIPMAEELTEDFFAQHYPGEDTTLIGQNYEALRKQAGEVIDLVQQGLPQYFPKPKSS